MNNSILKSSLVIVAGFAFLSGNIQAQQNVIAEKDNTRPEITRNYSLPARNTSVTASRLSNGYNDIQWSSQVQQDTRRFVVEYTTDGINYQSAGEVQVSAQGAYQLRHSTFESSPMLYRIRAEELNGKSTTTQQVLLDGVENSAVKIYPTVITGNVVNVNAQFPVERIIVLSESGQQVYTQDVNGRSDYMAINIPSLGKGIYFMTFYGRGWKSTSKFIIP